MANISLGTFMTDGARVGPIFSNPIQTNIGQNPAIYQTFVGNKDFNQGVLLAPWNVYSITPNAPGNTFTQFNNVAAATDFAAAGNFTLLGDNSVTTLVASPQGNNELVFDWPRQVTVTSSGNVGAVNVTIFGLDAYNFPLQQVVVAPTSASTLSTTKAFKVVTGAYASAATTGTTTISLGASGTGFGLPYAITDYSYVKAYWAGGPFTESSTWISGIVALNGATPVIVTPVQGVPAGAIINLAMIIPTGNTVSNGGFVSAITPGLPTVGTFSVDAGAGNTSLMRWQISLPNTSSVSLADSTNPGTNTTGDVRGIVTVPYPADGATVLTVYMNVQGANNWINQQAALNPPSGPTVNKYVPLQLQNLVGVPQYYTGING